KLSTGGDAGETAAGGKPAARFPDRRVGLEVMSGPRTGDLLPLHSRDRYMLGRAEGIDFTLPDNSISRRHGVITWRDEVLWVEDLNSSNGTTVNGVEIQIERLKLGDVVQMGETVLKCVALSEDHPAVAAPEAPGVGETQMIRVGELGREADLDRAFNELSKSLRESEHGLASLFHAARDAERAATHWRAVAKASARDLDALENRRRGVESDYKVACERISDLEALVSGDAAATNEQLLKARQEVANWRNVAHENENEIESLQTHVEKLQADLEQQRMALALAQAALRDERARQNGGAPE
ncbi:MAG: FHA domain-containing protein, partial [Planctomycetota bacterium]